MEKASEADMVDHISVKIAGYIAADAKGILRHSTELPSRTNPTQGHRLSPQTPRAVACGVGTYIVRACELRFLPAFEIAGFQPGLLMKSALNRIAVACLLLVLDAAVAAADDPPKLDVNMTCAAAAQYSISAGRDKEACLGDENTAQATLTQNWSKYHADDKSQCVGTVKTGGPPSYVELLSCIEILRDAKQIREGEPIVRDQSTSAPQSIRRRRR